MSPCNGSFAGFEPLDASFVFTPNQFFDYCLPNFSRGTARLVAYILHQTLRHLDDNGNPVSEDIGIPYTSLTRHAGISRGEIRDAIDEALAAKLIVCINEGQKDSQSTKRAVGEYRIAWDTATSPYTTDRDEFNGFFSGEGHRTPTPHAFFTQIIPTQTASTNKVVGAVIRHTVGYQTKHGGRRKESSLSYRYLQQYTQLSSRQSLSEGLKNALRGGFIERTVVGEFVPGCNENICSRYTLKWLDTDKQAPTSSKTVRVTKPGQKLYSNQFRICTETSPKIEPAEQFKNRTDKKEVTKETDKQQQKEQDVAVDEVTSNTTKLLIEQGIAEDTARHIAASVPADEIERQIRWLPHRDIRSSKAGLLIDACIKRYAEPSRLQEASRAVDAKRFEQRREALREVWIQQRLEDRKRWQQRAYEKTTDPSVKTSIAFRAPKEEHAHKFTLDEMALELGLEPITDRALRPQASAA